MENESNLGRHTYNFLKYVCTHNIIRKYQVVSINTSLLRRVDALKTRPEDEEFSVFCLFCILKLKITCQIVRG